MRNNSTKGFIGLRVILSLQAIDLFAWNCLFHQMVYESIFSIFSVSPFKLIRDEKLMIINHNCFCYLFVERLIASWYREKEKGPDKQQSVRTSRTNSKCKDQGKPVYRRCSQFFFPSFYMNTTWFFIIWLGKRSNYYRFDRWLLIVRWERSGTSNFNITSLTRVLISTPYHKKI